MKKFMMCTMMVAMVLGMTACSKGKEDANKDNKSNTADTNSGATSDGTTSASIVPDTLVQKDVKAKGFTDSDKKKVMIVVGDPRAYSVLWDMVNTSIVFFEENGYEVEVRDLYALKFNPVLGADDFYYAKDGTGEPSAEVKTEQEFVLKADHIIFAYPNWHDTPTAIVKGYMEKVFAKQFAYKDSDQGLEGLLKGKDIYTLMNAGFLGGGRGDIGDGVGIDDASWDEYMNAFKVLDDDTAGFWGVENRGRFVNDRTPKNNSENYEVEIKELREALKKALKVDFEI